MFEFSEEPRNNGKELLARFLKEKLEVKKTWGNNARVLVNSEQMEYYYIAP